jgi:hypothetical protein
VKIPAGFFAELDEWVLKSIWKGWMCSGVVEHLPTIHKALGSIPSI